MIEGKQKNFNETRSIYIAALCRIIIQHITFIFFENILYIDGIYIAILLCFKKFHIHHFRCEKKIIYT